VNILTGIFGDHDDIYNNADTEYAYDGDADDEYTDNEYHGNSNDTEQTS
jgi:hypothetical protein